MKIINTVGRRSLIVIGRRRYTPRHKTNKRAFVSRLTTTSLKC